MIQETIGDWEDFAVRGPVSPGESVRPEPLDVEEVGEWPEDLGVMADTSLTVPGRGEQPADCGAYMPLKYCPNCGTEHMLEHRCKGRRCPSCESIWTGERAEAATVRLQGARLAEPDGWRRRVVHAVASPADIGSSVSAFRRGARRAHELAKEHGVRGGAVIPHAFRVKEEVKAEFREEVESDDVRSGIWHWLKEERTQDWRASVYYSPHYHIVGFAEDVAESSPEEDDGWVFTNIRSVERVEGIGDMEAHNDVYGLFYYLLSHASFAPEESNHMVRWFGEYAYCNFSLDEALSVAEQETLEAAVRALREGKEAEEDSHVCEEGCEVELVSIREARQQLEDREWCEEIGVEQQRRLLAAWEWVAGDRPPPAGLRYPETEQQAAEAFEAILSNG